jgi:Dynamin family
MPTAFPYWNTRIRDAVQYYTIESFWVLYLGDMSIIALPLRSSIGLFGNSDVGKSSMINCLLDQPPLVPTSPNHACTAVMTRISHEDGQHKYAANIEHFTKEEWFSELRIIRDSINQKTNEMAISKSKLKAVYPGASDEEIDV